MPSGFHRPKETTARAIKPCPLTVVELNCVFVVRTRQPPETPAKKPDVSTAI